MKKLNIGKFAIEVLITAVLTAVILWILGSVINVIAPATGTWSSIVTLLIAAGLLIYAMKIRPGSESFVETLPIILITMALIEIIGSYTTAIPEIAIDFTWIGFALVLSAVFFADVIVKKFVMKKI